MSIIYLLYSPFKSLQFWGIKNEGLEGVEIPPNLSPSFLKNLPNKVIELLSLPLLYSPSFFLTFKQAIIVFLYSYNSLRVCLLNTLTKIYLLSTWCLPFCQSSFGKLLEPFTDAQLFLGILLQERVIWSLVRCFELIPSYPNL